LSVATHGHEPSDKKKQCKGCGWAGLNRRFQWQKLGEYLLPEALPRGGNLIDEKA